MAAMQEFGAQFMTQEGADWPAEYFSPSIYFDDWPKHSEIICRTMFVDPSMGKTDKSDYSAIIMVAADERGDYYIDADLERRPADKIVADAVTWHAQFRPQALGCEINSFQELFEPMFYREAQEQGEEIFFVGAHHHIAKLVRIRQLTPHLSRGELKFKRNSPGIAILIEQMRAFPAHKHDDGPDALAGAIKLTKDLLRGEITEHESDSSSYINP
jgi:predicted phage terminase large subunit-like protein